LLCTQNPGSGGHLPSHIVPSPPQIPQLSFNAFPPQMPLQSIAATHPLLLVAAVTVVALLVVMATVVVAGASVSHVLPLPPQTPQASRDALPPQTPLQSTSATQLPLQSYNALRGYLHDPTAPATFADGSKLHAFVSMHPLHSDGSPPHTPHALGFTEPPHVFMQSTPATHSPRQLKPFRA
jgi:hypothetical protein